MTGNRMQNYRFLTIFCTILTMLTVATQANAGLEVMIGGKLIKNGDQWFTPLNSGSNKIALFSQQREAVSIYNKGTTPITVNKIELASDKETVPEEFILQTTDMKPQTLNFQETTLPPGKRVDFYVRYYPVQSKHLSTQVNITYNGEETYSFRISGKGRNNAIFNSKSKTISHKLFGGPLTDEMVNGMVMDDKGRVFFSGQVTGIKDKFGYDIFYGCINPDNTLAWAKLWHGPYRDYARDSGQNAETGGTAGSIAIDDSGFIYLSGSVSSTSSNNNFSVLVLKINPDNGEPVWERLWRPEWPTSMLAKHSAEAYGLDVKGDQVLVTGTTGAAVAGSDALIMLLSLATDSGDLQFQYYFDPIAKTNDRGYAVQADGKGNIYIGGLMGKYGLLAKLQDNNGKLAINWVKEINMGWGSNINGLDIDPEGNIYLSCDRRGANTFFSIIKMSPSAEIIWAKTYKGGNNKNNNSNVVKVVGDAVYVAGRTGQSWYDSQMGDAQVIKLAKADGKELWSSFYFTGKGPDEISEHRIKGLAVKDNELLLLGQAYTGSLNGVRYWGYWYNGVGVMENYKPKHVKNIPLKPGDITAISKGEVRDGSGSRQLVDLLPLLAWQDASTKADGKAPDADLMFWRLKMLE